MSASLPVAFPYGKAQKRVLRAQGIRYLRMPNGTPVHRVVVEHKLLGNAVTPAGTRDPNFAVFPNAHRRDD